MIATKHWEIVGDIAVVNVRSSGMTPRQVPYCPGVQNKNAHVSHGVRHRRVPFGDYCSALGKAIAKAGFPLPGGDRRLGSIDGLRGWLSLSVAFHHFYIWVQIERFGGRWEEPKLHAINQLGAGAVGLFFMTTGLVFYPRVLAGWRHTSWVTVYITRAFRILPLVIISFLTITAVIYVLVGGAFNREYLISATFWVSSLSEPALFGYQYSGRANAFVLWSLKYEWLFYIAILPACAYAMDVIKSRGMPTWVVPLSLLVLSLLARVVGEFSGIDFLGFRLIPLFAVGMLAYEIQAREEIRTILGSRIISVISILGLIIAISVSLTPYDLSLPAFALFFISVSCGNSLFGALNTKSARVIGESSFSIYVLHGIILFVLFNFGSQYLKPLNNIQIAFVACVSVIVIILISCATYLLIERPAMSVGKRIARSWDGRKLRLGARELEIAP